MTSAAAAPEHPWLLPATLRVDADRARPRRSTRDWIVDTVLFLFSVLVALIAMGEMEDSGTAFGIGNNGPSWLIDVDFLCGMVGCAALWLRRRWPVGVAVFLFPLGLFSITLIGPHLISLFTVAVHRRLAVSAPLAGAHVLASMIFDLIRPDDTMGPLATLVWNTVFIGSVLAWGMFVRARRQLVLSLRERAERAEAEQQLRVAQARQLERTRIAREMHDVLAHRISLLSLHAGALEFRPDAPPEEISKAAGVIRSSAHAALEDLRAVIGVLREEPAGDGAPERPQPTLAELPALVTESRNAGMRVDLTDEVRESDRLPAGLGRSAYRMVQEGLTNARKHAAGARVAVRLAGEPGAGLTVEVRNPEPVGAATGPSIPGTGTGLVGLAERISLAGGQLEHGRTASGEFRLRAWLPWSA